MPKHSLSSIVTFIGLVSVFVFGLHTAHDWFLATKLTFTCAVLAVLEISLSFDNAVVNASVLQRMNSVWRNRFMTWGILIAVFGMRILLPVLVVAVLARLSPLSALSLAFNHPDQYAQIMQSAHILISAFGGTFLLMVALKFFIDPKKKKHWFTSIEKPLIKFRNPTLVPVLLTLGTLFLFAFLLHQNGSHASAITMTAVGAAGLISFLALDKLGLWLNRNSNSSGVSAAILSGRTSFSLFLYLEILDASFSFDGVIGAFAITNQLIIIAIGLGIGAIYVRSLTLYLVERQTLNEHRYLEHGAFYAIFALALMMFLSTQIEIPELITGSVGAAFIGLAYYSSRRHRRKSATK
jgi:hypothetical protein